MKRLLRFFFTLLLLILLAAGAGVAYAVITVNQRQQATFSTTVPSVPTLKGPQAIARGRYLTTVVASCVDCHDKDFGGKVMVNNTLMGTLAGSNLTRGRGGLGARYSDKDFVRALTHGVRKDGRSVIYMPSQDYKFSAADLGAIVAFLRSLPPVDRELPAARVGPMASVLTALGKIKLLPAEHINHQAFRLPASEMAADPVKAGEQLVAKGGCRGCHGPNLEGGFGPPPGGANLTPIGLGGWSERDFFKALRDRTRPDGTTLAETMPRAIGEMSDEDLRRVFAYLQTLPATGTKTKSQTGATAD